jgi:hypothetical protein
MSEHICGNPSFDMFTCLGCHPEAKPVTLPVGEPRQRINEELLDSLVNLVEQFNAYRNGWLGKGVWRDRIGLPAEVQVATEVISKAKKALGR